MSLPWPAGARRWTSDELLRDAQASRADFRARRLGEPLARYLDAFDATYPSLVPLVEQLEVAFAGDAKAMSLLGELWQSEQGRTLFRYLGAPPISTDDLQTLAETKLGIAALRDDGAAAKRLLDVMRQIVDPRRFPWIAEGRSATPQELASAQFCTTALIASQRVQTLRRGDEQAAVEGAVKGMLVGMGWSAAARNLRGVQALLTDSPQPRTYMSQTNLGTSNADVIVRLDNNRLLAIECKGSNSEINSRKRLNKEAAQNARAWSERFGSEVVAAVVLQGVFKARYVEEAQNTPMLVFWSHRLDDLRQFIARAL